jgi:hypothetical protein
VRSRFQRIYLPLQFYGEEADPGEVLIAFFEDCFEGLVGSIYERRPDKNLPEACARWDAKIRDDIDTKGLLFSRRAALAKRFFNEADDAAKALKGHVKTWRAEYLAFSGPRYPLGWMEKDRLVMETLTRYPLLVPFLNFVFDWNRSHAARKSLTLWRRSR